jgi:hypothetical protein
MPLPSPPHTLLTAAGRDTMKSCGDCAVATLSAICTGTQLDDASDTIAELTADKLPDGGTYTTALYVATVARRRPPCVDADDTSSSSRLPDVVHDTPPPRMPVPGDAPCAADKMTAPTELNTPALHTEDDDEPEGMLNDTIAVTTTVLGGTVLTLGLSDGVTEGDALRETETLPLGEDEADDDSDDDSEEESAALPLADELTEADADTEALNEEVAATDTLDDADTDDDTDGSDVTDADTLDDSVRLELTLAVDDSETLLVTAMDELGLPLDDALDEAELE